MDLNAVVQTIRRGVKAVPIAVRPLLLVALIPMATHAIFFSGVPKALKIKPVENQLPPTEELVRMIEDTDQFRRGKDARCWTHLAWDDTRQNYAEVCRALVALRYLDPETKTTTPKAWRELGRTFHEGGSTLFLRVAEREMRAVIGVDLPPQENSGYRNHTAVRFSWAWRETNAVGKRLGLSRQHRGMTGVAYFEPQRDGSWVVRFVRFNDATPDYSALESSR